MPRLWTDLDPLAHRQENNKKEKKKYNRMRALPEYFSCSFSLCMAAAVEVAAAASA